VKPSIAGKTDVGRQRDLNEDALLILPEFSMAAVADGLGGHKSGHLASQLAVSTLADFFMVTVHRDATWPFPYDEHLSDEENYLSTGIRLANRRIFDRSLKAITDFGMGTTCVAMMFDEAGKHVSVANVGDSRCYRIRAGEMVQLTRDHSLVSDAIHVAPWMTEEEIAQLPPNVITRALGIREEVQADLLREACEPGDIYLLSSDGLHGMISDSEILSLVAAHAGSGDLEAACAKLIDRANEMGGDDNVTVILARLDG
jgi:protein phosphatase